MFARRKEDSSFVFIIPVRNPEDSKVQDYRCIEAILYRTVQSLTRQIWKKVHIIVVCHQIPSWSDDFKNNVTFLNVSRIPVFPPDKNPVRIDKGLKYIIGTLYAKSKFSPNLIMPMDSDDYVNIELASKLMKKVSFKKNVDGYIVKKGLHIDMKIQSEYSIDYEAAYLIRSFDQSCGSCRIFKTEALIEQLRTIDADIENRFDCWPQKQPNLSVDVPVEPVVWLGEKSKSSYLNEDSIVNILGRHINQNAYFKFLALPFVGAAKGCGHGNHDGPRQGEIHQDKLIRDFSIQRFYSSFGISDENQKRDVLRALFGKEVQQKSSV